MNKAIFLDRDGVINRLSGGYVWKVEDFEVLDGVVEALQHFRDKGFIFVIITNQGGIARGIYSIDEVTTLNKHIINWFNENKIDIREIYFCPHHEDFGKCLCRKPGSLLLEKAMARFDIDPAQSYMIGDMDRDIEAAEKVGVKGIRIETNSRIPLSLE